MSGRMTSLQVAKLATETSPGEFRAVAFNDEGQAVRLFSQRWAGAGEPARYGARYQARLRSFVDTLRGAFCELSTGEEVFLRLKSREGVTEGQAVSVQVQSEARQDKLARVSLTDEIVDDFDAYQSWKTELGSAPDVPLEENPEQVGIAFEDALAGSVTLPGGGQLHIERTRAMTVMDVDSAGRIGKGSAGARALHLNRTAVAEAARQIGLRGLGGLFVLDCVSPINADAAERVHAAGRAAFEACGLPGVRVLKPSQLGLLEGSLPWRYRPIDEVISGSPGETDLLDMMRRVQREAGASPSKFFKLSLSRAVMQAYQNRKAESDMALHQHFSGRVCVIESVNEKNEVLIA
ncbi:MAG: ribonuclease E/G [Pseudomonadota bacterium]